MKSTFKPLSPYNGHGFIEIFLYYSDEEIDRVFCYFEDGMQTAKISKLLDIPYQTDSH